MSDDRWLVCPECSIIYPENNAFCSRCGGPLRVATLAAGAQLSPVPQAPRRRSFSPLAVALGCVLVAVLTALCTAAALLTLSRLHVTRQFPVPRSTFENIATAAWTPTPTPQQLPSPQPASPSPVPPTVTEAPPPTEAASPTLEAQPTATVTAGRPSATAEPTAEACLPWQEAGEHVGEQQCVCGTVTQTYLSTRSGTFFINFSDDPAAFYAVSFDYSWEGLEGSCIRVCGRVETYEGRPQIVIRQPERQLRECP